MTDDIRAIVASGAQLTSEQDDRAYALLSPEEYAQIPETQKPSAKPQTQATLTVQGFASLQNDWCVYVVNGVFVGVCKFSQMLAMPDMLQSKTFKTMNTPETPLTINLVGVFNSTTDANQHRDTLLASGPYISSLNSTEWASFKPHTMRCTSDGNTFRTIKDVTDFYGISRTTVYNGLENGKFERI